MRQLEGQFARELVVVGVHSAKFPSERPTANVRQAVLRYEVEHPVVNDADFRIWQEYATRAWPSLYVIDPRGKLIGRHEGELPVEPFARFLEGLIAKLDAQGLIDREKQIPVHLERDKMPLAPLSFPGKVLADQPGGRLFLADSNHNRVLVLDLDGRVRETIGSGEPGRWDGAFEGARFHRPQGLAVNGDTLWLADTENHCIREVDLAARLVSTIAGTGEQARQLHGGGPARRVALSSPWDLVVRRDADGAATGLYVAMAGFHQLWLMDFAMAEVRPFAGSAREGIADGPAPQAMLAQPSGVALSDGRLYFADSETSAIRYVDLADERVHTLVGLGLFEFGDRDGIGDEVRLQHPLGVAVHGDELLLIDSYNGKLKRLDPATRRVETVVSGLHEPGGLSVVGDQIYIADTNAHALRRLDLPAGQLVTIELRAGGG